LVCGFLLYFNLDITTPYISMEQ